MVEMKINKITESGWDVGWEFLDEEGNEPKFWIAWGLPRLNAVQRNRRSNSIIHTVINFEHTNETEPFSQ